MHTGQDRWIQKELAFTPVKNATTPNHFKSMPLQATGKENGWETEDTLERAAVTVETERAKWPNPWCLWSLLHLKPYRALVHQRRGPKVTNRWGELVRCHIRHGLTCLSIHRKGTSTQKALRLQASEEAVERAFYSCGGLRARQTLEIYDSVTNCEDWLFC
jgi:hypothetical protein